MGKPSPFRARAMRRLQESLSRRGHPHVLLAFFLALNVGWVFVAERRQGTLKRLRAAPVTRGHILLGKMLRFDVSKPDGTPRKLLDSSRIRELGWRPQISMRAGLAAAYADFLRGYGRNLALSPSASS